MVAKETTLTELGEMLAHVVEHMATKDDIAEIRKQMATKEDLAALRRELKAELASKADLATLSEQVASIERDLKSIRRDLSDLMDKVESIADYRKEIDHAFERIAAIEKHVGITRKLAA